MAIRTIPVNVEDASERQLLVFITNSLVRIEKHMSNLDSSVEDLSTAVTGIADRISALITPLQQALADAQAAGATDKAALDAALTDATENAAAIEAQVSQLNSLANPAEPPA